MTQERKELFDAAIGINFLVSNIAATIQNQTEELSWKQVEEMRTNNAKAMKRINAFAASVDAYLLGNTPLWAEQWDKAHELFAPYNEPYNPNDIDIEELTKEFVSKGLNEELAELVATTIKYPIED